MRMQKRKFRIGELAKHLNIEQFVIRFWEKEFRVKTTRSSGGQRFYSELDLETFKRIKECLYERGFTIAGAKKQLEEEQGKVLGSHKTTMELGVQDGEVAIARQPDVAVVEELKAIREQLVAIRSKL